MTEQVATVPQPTQAAPVTPIAAPSGMPSFASFLSAPEEIGPPKSILLYGPAGTRKTSTVGKLVRRLQAGKKMLVVDADQGTEVFVNDPEVWAAVQDGRIHILPIDKLDPGAFGKITGTIQEVAAVDYGYQFVSLDTLNIMQEVAVNYFLATVMNGKGQLDSRAAWQEVSKWTDAMARLLHNAKHTTGIFVMHEKKEGEEAGSLAVLPKLQGAIKDTIATIPSIVVHLSWQRKAPVEGKLSDETELVATLGESDVFVSKNRYSLPNRMTDFSLVDLYEGIDAKRGIPSIGQAPAQPSFIQPTTPNEIAAQAV